ncbi:MAG: hypothetical protein ACYDG4_10675 [Desulfuromonadaceae bacterium]
MANSIKPKESVALLEKGYALQFTESEMETLWKAARILYNRLEDIRPAGGFKQKG